MARPEKQRKRARLLRLWEKDNRCYYCRRPTILVFRCLGHSKMELFEDEATTEHLISRLHPDRLKHTGERTVLACWKRNNEQGNAEQASIGIEELRERSGRRGGLCR